MARLYPPQIEGKLPAFTGKNIKVPFQLNMAVGRNEFSEIAIIIKTVQNNTIKVNGVKTSTIEYDADTRSYYAFFNLEDFVPLIGQYYKIQIAFVDIDTQEVGYYSQVGVAKCTTQPSLTIVGLNPDFGINYHSYEYTGKYSQQGQDIAEKVYSYRFDLYNEFHQLIATSEEQLHNSSLDTSRYESTDSWTVTKTLNPNTWYSLVYSVKTINNLEVSTQAYKIIQMETVDIDINAYLSAESQFEDGYVDIWIKPKDEKQMQPIRGNFVLVRSSNEDNYESQNEIYRFELAGEYPNKRIWRDFTVQQGMTYTYAIQAYNANGIYSNRLEGTQGPVVVDFEDAFLFDGERQLKIRFNPKVSSFKSTILETKVNTLGGKYPFVFRNGNVEYKEFPISGLLTFLSDENELFIKGIQNNTNIKRTKTAGKDIFDPQGTELTKDIFRKERQFKMEALEWLTNGKPKIFRSPGEGNYIVRLINASLTPNDTLGRMLHTFNCTANEIAEYNFENLNKYGFITIPKFENREMKIGSLKLKDIFKTSNTFTLTPGAYLASFSNQFQDDLVLELLFADGKNNVSLNITNPTGHYNVKISNSPLVQIKYVSGIIAEDAVLTYGYYDVGIINNFSYISNLTIEDKIDQFIGTGVGINIIDTLEDIRLQTGRFYYIKIAPRTINKVFEYNSKYYLNESHLDEVSNWDLTAIYKVENQVNKWLDGSPEKVLTEEPNYLARLNTNYYTDLSRSTDKNPNTSGRFEAITNIDNVDWFEIGNGVIADVVYQLKTIEYTVEETEDSVRSLKATWLQSKKEYEKAKQDSSTSVIELLRLENAMNNSYKSYIRNLEYTLEKTKGDVIYAI